MANNTVNRYYRQPSASTERLGSPTFGLSCEPRLVDVSRLKLDACNVSGNPLALLT